MEDTGEIDYLGDFLTEDTYLFFCDVETCSLQCQKIFSLLNTEDCERFVKFKKPLRKYQFGIARCLVKQVLFNYFDIPLEHHYTLTNYSDWVVTDSGAKFYISISHSKNMVVVAISMKQQKLGVDIEFKKERKFSELLNGFASENEKMLFQESLDKKQMFYQLWTAKEAYIKAFQMTLSELTKIDLSPLHNNEVDQQGHLQKYTIEDNAYCLSLLSNLVTSVKLQKIIVR